MMIKDTGEKQTVIVCTEQQVTPEHIDRLQLVWNKHFEDWDTPPKLLILYGLAVADIVSEKQHGYANIQELLDSVE